MDREAGALGYLVSSWLFAEAHIVVQGTENQEVSSPRLLPLKRDLFVLLDRNEFRDRIQSLVV